MGVNEVIRAKRVVPMKNYIIFVEFDNGEKKIYNCYPLLQIPLFSELKDENFFREVYVDEMGVVCWGDSADIAPNELYNNSESVDSFLQVS